MGWCGIKYVFNKSRSLSCGKARGAGRLSREEQGPKLLSVPRMRPRQQSAGKVEGQRLSESMWTEWIGRGGERTFSGQRFDGETQRRESWARVSCGRTGRRAGRGVRRASSDGRTHEGKHWGGLGEGRKTASGLKHSAKDMP